MKLRIAWMLTACAAGLVTVAAQNGWADDDNHGRISYSTDDALVLGKSDDDWSFAGINTLILEGDRVWADNSGAIELEFPSGYYVRLADGSEAEIQTLPPDGLIRGWVGSFYVQRLSGYRGDMTFDTGAARFTFDPGTVARFDVLTDGATTLSVVDGRVSVFTDDGQVMDVGRGYRTYIDPGLLPSAPQRFSSGRDTFDVWNGTRVDYFGSYTEPEAFRNSKSTPVGARDLNRYGKWIYVDNSYYWRPIYVADYVPYRHGYWSYGPRYGYTWVGYYPFDYVTCHYGYWHYNYRYGWLWSYEPVYAPARVVSIYYGDVLFWAPASRYGYPVYGTHFDFAVGGFNFSFAYCSYAYVDFVFHHHHHNHYYAEPLHRHVIYNQPRTVQPRVWNYSDRQDPNDWRNIRRNSNLQDWSRNPDTRVRGFTQSDRRGDANVLARDLQDRQGRTNFRTDQGRRTVPTTRTSDLAGQRVARARNIEDIQDRGARTAPPERRSSERTQRGTIPRTPAIDGGDTGRAIQIDRTPRISSRDTTREQAIRQTPTVRNRETSGRERSVLPPSRDSGSQRGERSTQPIERRIDSRDGQRSTLPTDRGVDSRGGDRSATPIDRGTESRSRSRTTLPVDRGTGSRTVERQTLPSTRGSVERSERSSTLPSTRTTESRVMERSTLPTNRGVESRTVQRQTAPSNRSVYPDRGTDGRSSAGIYRPGSPVVPQERTVNRGSSPSTVNRSTAPRTRTVQPNVAPQRAPSSPSRATIESPRSSGTQYRSPVGGNATRSGAQRGEATTRR